MQLTEALEVLDRQVETAQMQQCIEQHGAVTVGKHEAVAVGPGRVGGVESEVITPEHLGDVCHTHGHAGMSGVGLLDSVHGQRPDGVGELLSGCHVELFLAPGAAGTLAGLGKPPRTGARG